MLRALLEAAVVEEGRRMTFSTLKPSTKPMKRTAFARKPTTALTGALSAESRQMAAKVKPVKCKACRQEFIQARPGQKVCGPDCAAALAMSERAKAERKALRAEQAEVKQKLEQYKPLEYWLKKTEAACNEYVRARDPDVCISCGVTYSTAWQAGHYISVGANRTLRYHEDNIHKQCIHCNMFKGSNALEYRPRLIEKIGLERVEWLESWHSPVKMTREAAEEIEAMYKGKLKALQGLKGAGE